MPGHVILAVEAASISSSNQSPMAAQLRNAGCDVLVSSNASEAVGLVFVSRRIEAVLINSYGEPMTGLEVAARLRAINPRIPILVVEVNPRWPVISARQPEVHLFHAGGVGTTLARARTGGEPRLPIRRVFMSSRKR